MTITVEIADTETAWAELLAKVEAGEEVIFARGKDPIAKLSRLRRPSDVASTIEEIRTVRRTLPRTRMDEILAWKDQDRR